MAAPESRDPARTGNGPGGVAGTESPDTAHEAPVRPQYPEQGIHRAPDAVRSLLPADLAPQLARVLFVHAHPDDESTSTGASMAACARSGAEVHLLTMTRGEMGEVIGEELAALDVRNPDRADAGEGLARVREAELAEAAAALGIAGHRFAARRAAPGFFRDSGMSWVPDGTAAPDPAASSDCLTRAPLEEAADAVAEEIRRIRPHVVVTYDADGGYGHPDHRRTHEAVVAALGKLEDKDLPRLVWGEEGRADPADERRQAVVDGDLERKREAMRAHRTQVVVDSPTTFRYSNDVLQPISPVETYRLLARTRGTEAEDREPGGPVSSFFTALVLGLFAGTVGTMLQAWIVYFGTAGWFPCGLVLALLLVLSTTLWTAHLTLRRSAALVPGTVSFLLVGVFEFARPDSPLVIASTAAPIGVVGMIWTVGTAVAGWLGLLVAGRRILPPRTRPARSARRRRHAG